MDVSKIGEALVSLGKALMADTPTKKEVELVADATHEAPEQFEELYDDFIAGTSAEYVEQAKDALDKVQERVRGAYLQKKVHGKK